MPAAVRDELEFVLVDDVAEVLDRALLPVEQAQAA